MAVLPARTEFAAALNQVAAERGIDPKMVVAAVEEAVVAAYRRDKKGFEEETEEEEGVRYEARLDPETGGVRIVRFVEGGPEAGEDVTPPGFGRIATQIAKQVIVQKVREAEKEVVIGEYAKRTGGLVNGLVLRFEGSQVVVDLGRLEAVMPVGERIPGESYEVGQRLSFLVKEIRETAKGREVIVSRADPSLVVALFRREVPEVASGGVVVQVIAREAGVRTKVAVVSTQSGVDPVGSCVGQKGVRVQAVIGELGGEKIDVIAYSEKVEDLIEGALAPASGVRVKADKEKRIAYVTVPENQLSLAIGKEGQNVRLVAKLTGYKIIVEGENEGVESGEDEKNKGEDDGEKTRKKAGRVKKEKAEEESKGREEGPKEEQE